MEILIGLIVAVIWILLVVLVALPMSKSMARDLEVENRYKAPDNLREPAALEKEYFVKSYLELGAERDEDYTEYVKDLSKTLKVTEGKITWVSEDIKDWVTLVDVLCQGETYKCCTINIVDEEELSKVKEDDGVIVFCCYNKKKEVQEIITVARKEAIKEHEESI